MIYSPLFYTVYLLPIALIAVFFLFRLSERMVSALSMGLATTLLLHALFIAGSFILGTESVHEVQLFTLPLGEHHLGVSFLIDRFAVAFLLLTTLLALVINKFSHTYLQGEVKFQSYFLLLNVFVLGMILVSLAGNLPLFFTGWELVGLASFFLIGFYNDRTIPVRNAFRVFSIYRICDVGLLFSSVVTHVYATDADHFLRLLQTANTEIPKGNWSLVVIFLLIFSAVGKSGQFPFFNWPARAMEGPTPSSAIFYGALSIHLGVFLLIRVYPIIALYPAAQTALAIIGVLSMLLATGVGRVQSNVKARIAYASVAQIGIMLVELSLGLLDLLLIHLMCHCLLRCYQILVSPSLVVDSVQHITRIKPRWSVEALLPQRLRTSVYSFAFQEGFLSISERGFFPIPMVVLKTFLRRHIFLTLLFAASFAFSISLSFYQRELDVRLFMAHIFGVIDVTVSLYCLFLLESPRKVWIAFLGAQFAFLAAMALAQTDHSHGLVLYALSALPAWAVGYYALAPLSHISLKRYNGQAHTRDSRYRCFLFAFVVLAGYPVSTIFFAEDVLFSELLVQAPSILFLTTPSFVLNGLICGKILVKTFWGAPPERLV